MKTLRFLSVLLLLCSLPICAFAMDEGYLHGSTKWHSNSEAVYVYLDSDDFNGESEEGGFYQYYTDLSDNCFYLHLSYTDSNLQDSGNNIRLNFNIRNSGRAYQFSVDENGFIHSSEFTDSASVSAFNARTNFGDVWLNGQEIYVGIEFLNKNDKKLNNYLSFSLTVNGHTYYLCDNRIKLAYGDYADSQTTTKQTTTKPSTTKESTTKETTTKTTTTKPSTTKEATTKQTETNSPTDENTTVKQTTTKKETTTKFKYTYTPTTHTTEKASNTTTEKTTKHKAESTTKFKYTGSSTTASSGECSQEGNTAENGDPIEENTTAPEYQSGTGQTENGIVIPETDSSEGGDPKTRLLTALAVIFAVAGVAFIVRNLPQKKENANENNEEE